MAVSRMSDTREPVLREVAFEDFRGVEALAAQIGLGSALPERWRRMWRDNPALQAGGAELPMGWVLEVGKTIVGYLGCIPLLYDYDGRTLLAVAASAFGVLPPYRGYSLKLAAAFYRLGAPDLFLNTTANEAAGKVSRLFGASPIPQRDYDRVLFWVLQAPAFLGAYLRKLKYGSLTASMAGHLLSGLLRCEMKLRERGPHRTTNAADLDLLEPHRIGSEFDDLWHRKTHERKRLLGYRTAQVLRWHFGWLPHFQRGTIIAARRAGKLAGYAAIIREQVAEVGLIRSRVVDIIVERDDQQVLDQLLERAYQLAESDGSHVLELWGFPKNVRERFLAWNPYSRPVPAWPFFYKVRNSQLRSELQAEDIWYASLYDGDGSL
jgi:hypothetical protein